MTTNESSNDVSIHDEAEEKLQFLIENGVLNFANEQGKTLLHIAAEKDNLKMV